MKKLNALTLALTLTFPLSGLAIQNGMALSYGTGLGNFSQPQNINGFNLAYLMQPDSWKWGHFSLSMNFSYGYWKTTENPAHETISTYGIAPVLRWTFLNNDIATPFLQASVGGAIMSSQYIDNRNLGSTVLFQDQGGIGLAFGAKQTIFATLQAMHYSNAGLASNNGGMTIPLLFTIGGLF